MSDHPLEQRISQLEQQLARVIDELSREQAINKEQTETLRDRQKQLIRQQRSNRRWIETIGAAGIGFIGVIFVVLLGLRLEFGWGSFALPAGILESSAIAAGASAGFKYWADRKKEA